MKVALVAFAGLLQHQWQEPALFCTIEDPAINESSGIAASRTHRGEYYTHNDSGDGPRFFRFDHKGDVKGVYTVKGAKAVDWEDMCSVRIKGRNLLFFADVGDNFRNRKTVVVYRVQEPKADSESEVPLDAKYVMVYPDGAHDCESLFVTLDGAIWLVTKSRVGESLVFVLRRPDPKEKNTLELLGTIHVDTNGFGGKLVTGADVSPDGRNVIVRTYTGALEFRAKQGDFEGWIKATPRTVKLADERQGEAVCYSLDGKSLLTTSESSPCQVSRLSLKTP